MPRKRPHRLIWNVIRKRIFLRDGGVCKHCKIPLNLDECHVDHIISGKRGDNRDENLRILCRRCHILRQDHRHRGMIANGLKDGIIPVNYRDVMWE